MINDRIQGHVDAAQEHRRTARKRLAKRETEGAKEEFEKALDEIRAGLDCLKEEEPPDRDNPTDGDRELAALFADVRGVEGGIYRDMIPLDADFSKKALEAYDAGASYEREFSLKSTYNCVNQLVLRFLDNPALLESPETGVTLDGRDEAHETDSVAGWLRRADRMVDEGYRRRPDPAWALADLVLLASLQASGELGPRLARFGSRVDRDGDSYPYVSLKRVVDDLVRITKAENPAGASLRELAEWLSARVPSD